MQIETQRQISNIDANWFLRFGGWFYFYKNFKFVAAYQKNYICGILK